MRYSPFNGARRFHCWVVLVAALIAQPALAVFNCEILPISPPMFPAPTSTSGPVDIAVSGIGCSGDITVTITELSNPNASSISPMSVTVTTPGPITFTVNTGATPGTYSFRADCVAGCFGSPSNTQIFYDVDVFVPVIRSLTAVGTRTFSAEEGSTAVLQMLADDNGAPAPGTTVLWNASGPVTLSASSSNTDAAGIASVVATFGPGTGPASIFASRLDASEAVDSFDVTVVTAVSRTLTSISGDGQTGPTNVALPSPLVIEARDNGAPISGIGITWSIVSGSATLNAPGNTTDASGRAQTGITFGPTPGPVVVRAVRQDLPGAPVDFNLTSTLVRTLSAVSGNGQTGPTNAPLPSPLVIEARDNGAPISGIGITWSIVSGSATLNAPGNTTDASGRAQTGITFGPTPGPVVVRAVRQDLPGAPVDFNLTSTLVRTLSAVSGNGQTGPTNAPLPSPLVIEARDNGAPISGIGITWSIVSGSATLNAPGNTTDASGRAQTGITFGNTPGPVVIRATRNDDNAVFADFLATSTFVRTLAVISGQGQQGLAGLPLPNPIIIEVRGNGLPEPNVDVEISLAGGATISDSSPPVSQVIRKTGADGRVTVGVTLGPTAGGVAIQASVPSSPGLSTSVAATSTTLASLLVLPELRELGGAVQVACRTIAAIPPAQRTASQNDLLASCQSFAGVSPDQLSNALDELLPDTALAMVSVALQAGQAQFDNLRARITTLRSRTQGRGSNNLAIAAPMGAVPLTGVFDALLGVNQADEVGADFDRWGWFLSGTLGRGEAEPGRRSPAYDFDINGLTAGLDYRISDQLVAGASLGYTRQDTELDGNEGSVDASGYSLSAYATYFRDQSWYTDAVMTWGQNDYTSQRRIRYSLSGPGGVTSVDQLARAQLDGDMLSLASTVGHDYQRGSWTLGSYGRLLYSKIDMGSGREVIGTGTGSGLALEIFPGTHTSFASVAGAKFSSAISRDWGILMPQFQIEWEREYRDDPQRVAARFLADPNGSRFTIDGDPIDNSFFRIGAGLSFLVAGGRSGFFLLERVVGKSGFTQTNLALGFRGEF
jgi:outer membrane autotransporter protein